MNITFLYHSSFLVELSGCTLLFDWYGGPVRTMTGVNRCMSLPATTMATTTPLRFLPSWGWTMSGTFWPTASVFRPSGRLPRD